jgi:hypothetical protein
MLAPDPSPHGEGRVSEIVAEFSKSSRDSAISPRDFFRARFDFQRLALERAWERRALDAPAAWWGRKNSHTSIVTTDTPKQPGAPHAMV